MHVHAVGLAEGVINQNGGYPHGTRVEGPVKHSVTAKVPGAGAALRRGRAARDGAKHVFFGSDGDDVREEEEHGRRDSASQELHSPTFAEGTSDRADCDPVRTHPTAIAHPREQADVEDERLAQECKHVPHMPHSHRATKRRRG